MTYALDPTRPVPREVRRVAIRQLSNAIDGLTGRTELNEDEAAHDARKRAKKLRALLRLTRGELPGKVYRAENDALRDAARRLSPVRDAWVLLGVLDKLTRHTASGPEPYGAFRALLVQEHTDHRKEVFDSGAVDEVVSVLGEVAGRVPGWKIRDRGWKAIEDGMARIYKQGRTEMAAAYEHPTSEAFHDWRKRAKYLRYQLKLVRGAWPEALGALEGLADDLGDLLGDEHDLSVLRDRVVDEPSIGPEHRLELIELIDRRREGLRARAAPIGRQLYADKPSEFVHRLGILWRDAA
jgi:CHAD domain-containing protein